MLGASFGVPASDDHANHARPVAIHGVHLEVERADGRALGCLVDGGSAGKRAKEAGVVEGRHVLRGSPALI
jgi:hypothetical protein